MNGHGDPPARPLLGIAALVALLLLAVLAVLAVAPARPRAADAPAGVFSAARVLDQLEDVADVPRTVGSPGHARARAYLLATLGAWGWRTEVHEAVGATDFGQAGTQPVALVRNVVATWPGTDPTGTVLLAAHYDTVAGSPGAADDGLGVGTVLEVARALSTAGAAPPRNDVVVLLTDAEEPGLLGAEAFARERAAALGQTVVLNHEARGAAGAPTTFRTTSPNEVLLGALSRAPGASVESSAEAAFEALPNNSDLTPLAGAGLHGLDTAIAAGSAHYHSPVDDLAHLSPASVQQMGDTSLAVARDLAAADLAAVADGGEQVVTTLPWGLLRYPQAAEGPLALAALAGAAVLVALRRRRRALTLPRTALSALVAVLLLAAAGAAGWATWQLALLVDPGQASVAVGDPYRPTAYAGAVLLAGAGVVLGGYALVRSALGPAAVATGAVTALAVSGALLALVPGVSGVLVLPVLCALAGALAAELLPGPPLVRTAAVLAGSAGATLLLGPGAWLALDVGLATGGPAGAVFLGTLLLLVLPLVDSAWPQPRPPRRRQAWRTAAVPMAVLLLGAGTTAAGLVANREGATPPRQEQLVYVLDAGTGTALWASRAGPRSAWSADLLTEAPARLDEVLPRGDGALLASGPAPVVDLAAPEVAVVADTRTGGQRELVLRLASARGAPAVGLWVDAGGATVRAARVAGRELPVNGAFGPWDFGFVLEGAPAGGVEVRLLLEQRDDALAVRVADRSDDLAAVPGATPPPGRVLVTPQLWVAQEVEL